MSNAEMTVDVAAERSAPAPVIRRAPAVVAAAAGLGLVGQLLFHGVGLGINFPIAVALLVGGGWLLRSRSARPRLTDAWLGPAAVVFAAFAAVRADPTIESLDVLTALGLAGAALASFAGRDVVGRGFASLLRLGVGVGGWVGVGAVPALSEARRLLPAASTSWKRIGGALPVVRGLAIAIPVVLVFVALFASADAVFARVLEDFVRVDLDPGELISRALLAALLAWFAAGAIALSATEPIPDQPATLSAPAWRLGTTEAITVLLAVDALFVAFVALQAAYLFGGLDTLGAIGMTYADYARRGFFELVAVTVLAGGLVVVLERTTRERHPLLIGSAIALTVLTGVVLASAGLRLRLYQEAYGWTELRLYVLATIVLLGIGLVALVACLVADRVRWIGHVVIAAGLVIGLALNVIGPVRFITEQNVARLLDPSLVPQHGSTGLDEVYALSLGDDGIPSLVRALPHLDQPQARDLRTALEFRLEELRGSPGLNAWQAWNLGRERARHALEAADGR